MGRGQTPTAATAALRALLGLIAAVIFVLTFRQGIWALLHVVGLTAERRSLRYDVPHPDVRLGVDGVVMFERHMHRHEGARHGDLPGRDELDAVSAAPFGDRAGDHHAGAGRRDFLGPPSRRA